MKIPSLFVLFSLAIASPVFGEGASLEREFGLRDEFFPRIEAPASIASGVWQLKLDEKVDGKVTPGRIVRLRLRSANSVIVGGEEAESKPNAILISGRVVPGLVPIVQFEQHGERKYRAFFTGIQMDSGEIVGTYVDTNGFRGDWSLSFEKMKSFEPAQASLPDAVLFESVLGVYGKAIRGKRREFINLRPPARNLWTEEIQRHVAEALPYGDVDYIGAAKLVIAKAGKYTIHIPGAGVEFKINDQRVEAGVVELKRGVYNVEIYTNHWGQPYLTYAEVSVSCNDTKETVPFVNSIETIKSFRRKEIADHKPVEVCEYEMKRYEPPGE